MVCPRPSTPDPGTRCLGARVTGAGPRQDVAAAAKTPISTVIMVSELTGNYGLLVPSMWVCAGAFLVSRDWTIYRSQLPSRGIVLPQTGASTLEAMGHLRVGDVFRRERRFVRVRPTMTVPEILQVSEQTRQRIFPVTDEAGILEGAFRIDRLIHAVQDHPGAVARDLLDERVFFVRETDPIERAQRMLRNNHLEEVLVVVDGAEQRLAGILTMADLLLAYQRVMAASRGGRSVGAESSSEEASP